MADELTDAEIDDVLARVRRGVGGIQARPDAPDRVHRVVGLRRRRRRALQATAAVAVAIVAVPAALLALQADGDDPVRPAEDPSSSETLLVDGRMPAAFFADQLDGRVRAQVNRYRAVAGERYFARFLWWPEFDDPAPYYSGAAVETWDDVHPGSAAEACEALLDSEDVAGAECTTTSSGQVVRVMETTADLLRLDPLHRKGTLDNADPDDVVRAATLFRDDGWAVSLAVCACRAWKYDDAAEPPVGLDDLAEATTPEGWVPEPTRAGSGRQGSGR